MELVSAVAMKWIAPMLTGATLLVLAILALLGALFGLAQLIEAIAENDPEVTDRQRAGYE